MAKKVKLRVSGRLLRKKTRRNGFRAPKRCRFTSGEIPGSQSTIKTFISLKVF